MSGGRWPSPARTRLLRHVAVLAVPVALVVGIQMWRTSFDAERWRTGAGVEQSDNPRSAMAPGVCDWLLAERPTRAEVHARLGEPDYGEGGDAWCVGIEPGVMAVDPWALQVAYGADDRVASARIGE